MSSRLRLAAAVLAVIALGVLAWRAWAPRASDADVLNGYVEGDDLYLSSPIAGNIARIWVVKGQRVAAGAPLFLMDPATLAAQKAQSRARLDQARAQILAADAQAAQADASVAAARASETDALQDLQRYEALKRANPEALVAQQLDQARAAATSARAQRVAAEKAAAASRLQAASARASAVQAEASLAESDVKLGQLAQHAPTGGLVEDVAYQTGEWAGPNQPIVSLLPDDQVKLWFFVPEAKLYAYRPGRIVRFSCDGCRPGLTARIDYVAPRAEFTPPVIYSRNTRDKLVFLVEAVPPDPRGLAPGLPVDVQPLAGSGGAAR